MDKLVLATMFKSYRPKVDGSLTISFDTQEVSSEQVATIHNFRNQYGALVFKIQSQLTEEEMRELDSLDLEYNGLSKSKRLKNVLFRYWEKSESVLDEKAFYALEMEKIINHYKNKLD